MKKTVLETVVERSQHLEASLKTLAYAMEAMKNIDNGEKELREIGWDVENQIEILQEYQKETIRLLEQPESDDVEGAERAEIKGKMLTKADAEVLIYEFTETVTNIVDVFYSLQGFALLFHNEQKGIVHIASGVTTLSEKVLDQATDVLVNNLDTITYAINHLSEQEGD